MIVELLTALATVTRCSRIWEYFLQLCRGSCSHAVILSWLLPITNHSHPSITIATLKLEKGTLPNWTLWSCLNWRKSDSHHTNTKWLNCKVKFLSRPGKVSVFISVKKRRDSIKPFYHLLSQQYIILCEQFKSRCFLGEILFCTFYPSRVERWKFETCGDSEDVLWLARYAAYVQGRLQVAWQWP